MASLYAQYIKERENKDIVESDKGFATYQIFDNGECYIQDIFVAPEFRSQKVSYDMEKEISHIAKEKNCHSLIGSVCLDTNHASRNLQILLNDKWHLYKIIGNMIFVKKDIK